VMEHGGEVPLLLLPVPSEVSGRNSGLRLPPASTRDIAHHPTAPTTAPSALRSGAVRSSVHRTARFAEHETESREGRVFPRPALLRSSRSLRYRAGMGRTSRETGQNVGTAGQARQVAPI